LGRRHNSGIVGGGGRKKHNGDRGIKEAKKERGLTTAVAEISEG